MNAVHKLDQEKTYAAYDKQDINFGLENMPRQFLMAWESALKVKFPAAYKKVERIVLVGMGGSHLAPYMLQQGSFTTRKVPFEIVHGYSVPAYVNSKTLVILSSFSGNTEEVLEAGKDAYKKRAKIVTISAGGKLANFAKRNRLPHFVFDPGEFAAQPRLGLGFSFAGIAAMLKQLGLIKMSQKEIHRMMNAMVDVIEGCNIDIPAKENPAKTVADELHGRAVLVVGAEHLVANAHIIQNQINETAKQYCTFMTLPELNHHFLEGLMYPEKFFEQFSVIMLRSDKYHARIQKRFDITADMFEQQGGQVIDYLAKGETLYEEQAELLQFGSFFSYYLGMLNGVDPQFIPFVKEFKKKL